jgi:hypothetical protein
MVTDRITGHTRLQQGEFITVKVRTAIVMHGYTNQNKENIEELSNARQQR